MTDTDKLIKTEIKGRQVTYYLTTEDDLNNVKSNSLLGDIFSVLTSLSIGGIISVALTKAIGVGMFAETLNILNILLYIFIALTIIFGFFTGYFYLKSFNLIEKIKESGAVKSLNRVDKTETETEIQKQSFLTNKDNTLQIINAFYWTPKVKLDVTEELRKMIIDNRLETIASNKIKGDPDHGTPKKLTINYKFNGITITKEFREKDNVLIP